MLGTLAVAFVDDKRLMNALGSKDEKLLNSLDEFFLKIGKDIIKQLNKHNSSIPKYVC